MSCLINSKVKQTLDTHSKIDKIRNNIFSPINDKNARLISIVLVMTTINNFLNQDTITTFGILQYTRISIRRENLKTTIIIITESKSMTNLICDSIPQFVISKDKIRISREVLGNMCKVEFYQPSCWLYSVSNLLVF